MRTAADLNKLDESLFKKISHAFSPAEQTLLQSQWERLRKIAVQNAGYGSWGAHLLRLSPVELDLLEQTFRETIRSIEGEHLHLEESLMSECSNLPVLRFLLDQTVRLTDLSLDQESAKAMFLEYDPKLVAQYRTHFQEVFKFLAHNLIWQERDPLVAEMFLGNLIALLPYFDFEQGAILHLLKRIDDQWRLVSYQLKYIPLIEGKIRAYGLDPTQDKASPMLVFQGTPYPAASGFFEAIWSDLHPTKSVGEDIFKQGKPQIDQWLAGKEKVECYGLSLGGALAYHAGQAYGSQVEVHAYVAPGLIPMKGGMSRIHGRVFFHYKDLIKSIGFHPESDHFTIYAVLTKTEPTLIEAHTRPPGIEPTLILKINPRYENRTFSRYFFSFLKIAVSTILFLVLYPIHLSNKIVESFKE